MNPTTPAPNLTSNLLAAAGDIDLACISNPPAALHLENLRRRGIDVVRIKWSTGAKAKGWKRFFGFGRRAADDLAITLAFVDRQISYQNSALRGAAGREIQLAMDALSAIEKLPAASSQPARLRLGFGSEQLIVGDGLPDDALNWLRDRMVLEAAGLAWKPLFNVGKRSTRLTSNPDDELYRRWSSSQSRLIGFYLDQAAPKIADLEAALAANDMQKGRAAAHWLKSSSAAVGAMQLSELCQRLEIDLDAKDKIRAAALSPHLFAEFQKVSAALRQEQAFHADAEADTAAGLSTDPGPNLDGPLAGLSTLLVEDSRVNQEIASDCLLRAGASVTLADDGEQAMAKHADATFDVILMDCQMTGLDGFATTRKIRETEMRTGRAPTPIIALTANALRDDRQLCLSAGMNDYLSKPFAEADLIEIVMRWTRKSDGATPSDADGATASDGSEIAA